MEFFYTPAFRVWRRIGFCGSGYYANNDRCGIITVISIHSSLSLSIAPSTCFAAVGATFSTSNHVCLWINTMNDFTISYPNMLTFLIFSSCLFASCPALPHLERCVAVIRGVFNQEVLQHADGQLPDLGPLLQGLGHLPQEQAHQKVVAAVVLGEAELQALLCCSTTRDASAGPS